MATSYGVSQLGILNALMSGKTKSDIYDMVKEKKEKLFEKGVKPSQIEKMDKLFDKRFDNAMDDYRYKLKNRPGMKEYRKKQRSAPASDTGSEFNKGGMAKYKQGSKGAINPGEKYEERMREYRRKRQKEAAKIEMVSKLGQRKKHGKYARSAPGASKATDTESALTTFNVQKMFDKDFKKGKGPNVDLISDRQLARKEGSMRTGGLTGGQKKLDKNKNNRIDAEDFKILRGGRSAMKARLGSRVPPVIRPKPTAGGKPLTPKPIKPKPKPKMGGGMMKRYTKGGGADTGTMGEAKSKLATGIDAFRRRIKKQKLQAPKRPPMNPAKAMGGGMMKRPMGYKKGKEIDYGEVFDKKFYSSALGKEAQLHADDYDAGLDRAERRAASETMALMKKNKKMGKMGGGMVGKPMGYKSGTSVKVKCKLGRNKPTKMY